MWLVVGLGNPGPRYAKTRHNAGFMVVEAFADAHGLTFIDKTDYRIVRGSSGGEKIILLEPLTFMNRSGGAVGRIASKSGIPPERVIVIHDDLDLATGTLKIRKKGSSGGHKGVESVIQHLGSGDFLRIKLGIGRDKTVPVEEYVLAKFRKDELPAVKEMIAAGVSAIEEVIASGPERAMNRIN